MGTTVGPIGPKWAPLWTHETQKWVPPYVGPTELIICGAYYSLKKKPLKSDEINSHSIYVAPHKTPQDFCKTNPLNVYR